MADGGPALAHHDDPSGMVSVDDARDRILSRIQPLAAIDLPLQDALGCVLAADVTADRDIPAFASSAMDGFAVRSGDVVSATPDAPARLRAVGRALIGQRPNSTVGGGEAIRIATGAPIPAGADCVAPIEECRAEGDSVDVLAPIPMGKHIRPAAEDVRVGETLVPAGRRIGAPELGMLAAAGYARVPTYPRPRVVVISTGNELVEPGQPTDFGQIYDSNSYTLVGALKEVGCVVYTGGIIKDDVEQLKEAVLSHMAQADAFISTGGVSVGDHDVVKAAFFRRGDIDFYRVAMQPGMPQGFGFIEGKPFFGLPGNPVSVFVSFEIFIRPTLMKMMARGQLFRPQVSARTEEEITGPRDKTVFARVLVRRTKDGWIASPTGGRGSNLLATVVRANGLAIIPPGVERVAAGGLVDVMVFRSLED